MQRDLHALYGVVTVLVGDGAIDGTSAALEGIGQLTRELIVRTIGPRHYSVDIIVACRSVVVVVGGDRSRFRARLRGHLHPLQRLGFFGRNGTVLSFANLMTIDVIDEVIVAHNLLCPFQMDVVCKRAVRSLQRHNLRSVRATAWNRGVCVERAFLNIIDSNHVGIGRCRGNVLISVSVRQRLRVIHFHTRNLVIRCIVRGRNIWSIRRHDFAINIEDISRTVQLWAYRPVELITRTHSMSRQCGKRYRALKRSTRLSTQLRDVISPPVGTETHMVRVRLVVLHCIVVIAKVRTGYVTFYLLQELVVAVHVPRTLTVRCIRIACRPGQSDILVPYITRGTQVRGIRQTRSALRSTGSKLQRVA